MLGALWAPLDDASVDEYLRSITTIRHREDTGCINPSWLLGLSSAQICPDTPTPSQAGAAAQSPGPSPTSANDELFVSPPPAWSSLEALQMQGHQRPSTSPGQTSSSTPSVPTTTEPSSTPLTDVDNPVPGNRVPARFVCQEERCSRSFGSQKDLDRHRDSVHGSSGADVFRCRCGKTEARKDNHDRHVRKCRLPTVAPFCCRCGREAERVADHLEHASRWSRRFDCP